MPVSADQFRQALREWASGVSIITTRCDGGIRGITVSSFCSLSLRPPLVLICIARTARSHPLIAAQGAFAVNILRAGQEEIAERAAGRRGERGPRLEEVEWISGPTGAPRLADCLAWLDCSLAGRHEEGDHTIFVGRVEAAGRGSGGPLLYHAGRYGRLRGVPRSE